MLDDVYACRKCAETQAVFIAKKQGTRTAMAGVVLYTGPLAAGPATAKADARVSNICEALCQQVRAYTV